MAMTKEERASARADLMLDSFHAALDALETAEAENARLTLEVGDHYKSIAALRAELALASYPGHYISNACQRGKHDNCRLNEKFSDEPCLCSCGHPDAGPKPPTYDELKSCIEHLHDVQRDDRDEITSLRAQCAERSEEVADLNRKLAVHQEWTVANNQIAAEKIAARDAEIASKDAEYAKIEFQAETATRGLESVAAENQTLRAEVAELKEALTEAKNGFDTIAYAHSMRLARKLAMHVRHGVESPRKD